jgi:hypothetical protein
MAIVTYALDTGSTFKTTAITDAKDFTFSESGSSTKISTDGSRSVGLIVVDQKTGTVAVNGVNQVLLSGANFRVGSAGSLVLKAKLRGAGTTVSTAATFTFANAVLVSTSAATPNEGNGTVTLNFECYDPADNNAVVAIS